MADKEKEKKPEAAKRRKAYVVPALLTFGSLTALTGKAFAVSPTPTGPYGI